jgi:hypothetical protein
MGRRRGRAATRHVTDTSTLAPTAAVEDGVQGLLAGDALTATVRLEATSAALQAISTLPPADLSLVSGSSLVLETRTGGAPLATSTAGSYAATLSAPGHPTLAQVVAVGGTLFARGDAQTVAGLFGAGGALARLTSRLPPSYAFLADAVAGGWLRLSEAGLVQALKASSPSGIPTLAPAEVGALQSALADLVRTDVTATRMPADPARGDHLVLTGGARTLATALLAIARADLGTLPGAPELLAAIHPAAVPARTVRVDAYVEDGRLDQLDVDLTPLLDPAQQAALTGRPVTLEVSFTPTAAFSTPATATPVPAAAVGGLVALATG